MTRFPLTLLALALVTGLAACADSGPADRHELTKEEAAALKGDLPGDICEDLGWYGDGVCDTFCPSPDPDCDGGCPDPDDPSVHYVADSDLDPAICTLITFGCEPDQVLFSDDCGCGCIDAPEQPADPEEPVDGCPDPADPAVHYEADSDLDPSICTQILFHCEPDQQLFSDECGCGCIDL